MDTVDMEVTADTEVKYCETVLQMRRRFFPETISSSTHSKFLFFQGTVPAMAEATAVDMEATAVDTEATAVVDTAMTCQVMEEIGRASCRERV